MSTTNLIVQRGKYTEGYEEMIKKISRLGFFKEVKNKGYHLLVGEEMCMKAHLSNPFPNMHVLDHFSKVMP